MSNSTVIICDKYKLMLDRFLSGEICVHEFQERYLASFKSEVQRLDVDLYEVLQKVFGDVDSYTEDPDLLVTNPSFYLNEVALRKRIQEATLQLSDFKTRIPD